MQISWISRLWPDGREVIELFLRHKDGPILESSVLHVRNGRVILPAMYAPTVAGALDYGHALWAQWLPEDERPF